MKDEGDHRNCQPKNLTKDATVLQPALSGHPEITVKGFTPLLLDVDSPKPRCIRVVINMRSEWWTSIGHRTNPCCINHTRQDLRLVFDTVIRG